jgi:hypothetical protein
MVIGRSQELYCLRLQGLVFNQSQTVRGDGIFEPEGRESSVLRKVENYHSPRFYNPKCLTLHQYGSEIFKSLFTVTIIKMAS